MFLAMGKDIRVILIKLADRLHNMRTLSYIPRNRQIANAKETMDLYAPLANRLGIYSLKWELEDLSFRYLYPEEYRELVAGIEKKREERLEFIDKIMEEIKVALKKEDIKAEITGRAKHLYSIYRKMKRDNITLDQVYDLFALRIIVNSVKDCYAALGVVHELYSPMPGRFKDYIAVPKPNMYQSIHTTLIGPNGTPFEVQVRTWDMHRIAEFGIAAHWAYKEGRKDAVPQTTTGTKLNLFKEILELQKESNDASEFMESVKGDLFSDRVYVFTPKGDVFELPKGSGPLDMAYSIHTEIGAHTTGAKVNGKIRPLDYQLKNGDIVDILTSQNSAGPSQDWLDLVHTSKARNKIKHFFKKRDREENIEKGREILIQELTNAGYNAKDVLNDNMAKCLEKKQFKKADDLYASIGSGDTAPVGIVNILTADLRKKADDDRKRQEEKALLENHQEINNDTKENKKPKQESGILIEGIDNLLVRLSHCCNPVPGDDIVGYITKGRGVSVHRVECPNVKAAESQGTRLIDVSWNILPDDRAYYNADLEVQGYNRDGLLNDILQAINNNTKSLNSVNGRIDHNKMANISATIGVKDKEHLQRIIDRIKNIPDVYMVKRPIH